MPEFFLFVNVLNGYWQPPFIPDFHLLLGEFQ